MTKKSFAKNVTFGGFIFQIKSSGDSVDTNPTLTFTLKSNLGFHIELFEDHHGTTQYIPMLSLHDAVGKWIQVGHSFGPKMLKFGPGVDLITLFWRKFTNSLL
jgi:hypothetical protein